MSTGEHGAGQVRGPVQITWARSIDPILAQEVSITRVVKTNPNPAYDPEISEYGEMGRRSLVPYGLYRAQVYVNPFFGLRSGFSGDDLGLLWEGLQYSWDLTRTSSKGMMSCRGLHVFTHDTPRGNAHAHKLFDSVQVAKVSDGPARSWRDYRVDVPETVSLPEGVTLTTLVG
jgi:CRISPR-associated protein Csd2